MARRTLGTKEKKVLAILSGVLYLCFMVILFFLIGKRIVAFASDPEAFRSWVDAHGLWGKFSYIALMFLQVVVAIIPGGALEIAGGYAFGVVEASLLSMIGIGLGSVVTFLLASTFGVSIVEVFYSREKIHELKFMKDERLRDTLIFLFFLIPGTPKDLLSYVCGLTGISLKRFLVLSLIGRLPAVIGSSLGGSAMGEQKYLYAVIVFVVIVILSFLGGIIYKKICSHQNRKQKDES